MPATYTDARDGLTTSVAVKAPCRVATTAAITLSGVQTIDGVACVAGDRVLVKDQSNAVDNGIWVVGTGSWSRALDFDGTYDSVQGTICKIISGDTNGASIAEVTTSDPIVIGSSEIAYQLSIGILAGGVSSYARTLLDDVDAATARTTLGIGSSSSSNKYKNLQLSSDGITYGFRRSPFYDPYQYGAVGDGVTDDTAALNACIAAAVANEGIQASAKGYGTVIIPPGFFATSGITISYGITILGAGGRLQSLSANVNILTVAANKVVVENIVLYDPFLPTVPNACLKHTSGADCTFRKVHTIGGYRGIWGEGANAGDSYFIDCKVFGAYSDYVYLTNYGGMWAHRCKFDGYWPVAKPTSANIKGARATSTAYSVNDMVTSNGYWFQCSVAGTSSSGSGPTYGLLGVNITDGTVTWKTHRTQTAAGVHIESDCFVNSFVTCDFSAGHDSSVWLSHTVGTNASQGTYFSGLCEFGRPISYGLRVSAGDEIHVTDVVIDGGISSAAVGVSLGTSRSCKFTKNDFYGWGTGIQLTANAANTVISENSIQSTTTRGIDVLTGTKKFTIIGNMINLGFRGTNVTGVDIRTSATTDEYIIVHNNFVGCSTAGLTDGSSATNKTVSPNIS